MEAGLLHQDTKMARKAIWESIATTTAKQLIAGYSELIQWEIDQKGSNAFLLTFMFKPLPGSKNGILIQMNNEVQRVYSTFVTRVARDPRSESQKDHLPFMITAPDRSGSKRKQQTLSDWNINDGLHIHGILCVPWKCRLKVDVPTHFAEKQLLYVKNQLLRIDIRPIYSTNVTFVVDYAFAALKNGNATLDDIQVYH